MGLATLYTSLAITPCIRAATPCYQARTLWGGLINNCRNVVRGSDTRAPHPHPLLSLLPRPVC